VNLDYARITELVDRIQTLLQRDWVAMVFLAAVGASAGSFLNVVVYRLPLGRSLFRPRSVCPTCGRDIPWYLNIPVLSWIMLRGHCRWCHTWISPWYLLVEAGSAGCFAGLYAVYFLSPLRPEFAEAGPLAASPVLWVHLVLVATLIAATLIDARFFIIPLAIPWFATFWALLIPPVAVRRVEATRELVPVAEGPLLGIAFGGVLGLGVAILLLRWGLLPLSFSDLAEDPPEAPETEADLDPALWPEHPHPRLEVLKECLFLAWPIAGMLVAAWGWPPWDEAPAWWAAGVPSLEVLAGACWGYLVGGGLIWLTRIGGTLLFGKEAMGLGDVHLLAAIGAVFGAADALAIYLLAPVLGLVFVFFMLLVSRFRRRPVGMMPYGPCLAVAALVWMVMRQPLIERFVML